MKRMKYALCVTLFFGAMTPAEAATSIVFVGNSFTSGAESIGPSGAYAFDYKQDSVTSLTSNKIGGIAALFKDFTVQAGLDYSVSVLIGGGGIETKYTNRKLMTGNWDAVVLQSLSVLDENNPGDPTLLIEYTGLMANAFHGVNPDVDIFLTATWSRADLTYRKTSPWLGKPIDAMAKDLQSGYEQAAAASPYVTDVIEVGAAWNDAMITGLADPNPYDGITPGSIDLWRAADRYHASAFGSYLSALMQFGRITGADPRSLGGNENAAVYFGFTREQTVGLQEVAYNRLHMDDTGPLPEPATWAMLIGGFGAIGLVLRCRRATVSA